MWRVFPSSITIFNSFPYPRVFSLLAFGLEHISLVFLYFIRSDCSITKPVYLRHASTIPPPHHPRPRYRLRTRPEKHLGQAPSIFLYRRSNLCQLRRPGQHRLWSHVRYAPHNPLGALPCRLSLNLLTPFFRRTRNLRRRRRRPLPRHLRRPLRWLH